MEWTRKTWLVVGPVAAVVYVVLLLELDVTILVDGAAAFIARAMLAVSMAMLFIAITQSVKKRVAA